MTGARRVPRRVEQRGQLVVAQLLGGLDDDDERLGSLARARDHAANLGGSAPAPRARAPRARPCHGGRLEEPVGVGGPDLDHDVAAGTARRAAAELALDRAATRHLDDEPRPDGPSRDPSMAGMGLIGREVGSLAGTDRSRCRRRLAIEVGAGRRPGHARRIVDRAGGPASRSCRIARATDSCSARTSCSIFEQDVAARGRRRGARAADLVLLRPAARADRPRPGGRRARMCRPRRPNAARAAAGRRRRRADRAGRRGRRARQHGRLLAPLAEAAERGRCRCWRGRIARPCVGSARCSPRAQRRS